MYRRLAALLIVSIKGYAYMGRQVIAKLTLSLLFLVVLVPGCTGSTPPTGIPIEPTHTAISTPTLTPTTTPTAEPTQTPLPTLNIEATVAAKH